MSDAGSENVMKHDLERSRADGLPGHPRKFGSFPPKIREYALKRKVISLPNAIRSSSALTAEALGIKQRGALRVGYFADVVVFDERTIADQATYAKPELLATGMRYVIVNGKLVVEDGKYNGTLAGKALRRSF